jgi:DNA repair exonuclease SbcCD ATPase subunit
MDIMQGMALLVEVINERDEKIERLSSHIKPLQSDRIAELESHVVELQEITTAFEKIIDDLERKSACARTDTAALALRVQNAEWRIQELYKIVGKQQETISTLRNTISEMNSRSELEESVKIWGAK